LDDGGWATKKGRCIRTQCDQDVMEAEDEWDKWGNGCQLGLWVMQSVMPEINNRFRHPFAKAKAKLDGMESH